MKRLTRVAVLSGGMLLLTSPVLAQVSPNNQRPPEVGNVAVQQQPSAATPPAAPPEVLGVEVSRDDTVVADVEAVQAGGLALTGGDIAGLAALGAGAAGVGIAAVRLGRRRTVSG